MPDRPETSLRDSEHMRFSSTKDYVATQDLEVAVNAAIVLERPLLVKGEPGTGKTVLAEEVAKAIKAPLLTWHIKSTTKAQQGLYEYDAVSRLRDSQLGDERVSDISNYIKRGKLWDAFTAEQRPVLLIDEIDKADIEFPNDLLLELDRMEFFVYETGENIKAKLRPIVMITSNNEKELPDAFLRRCFFHYIKFPDQETMNRIVDVHFPGIKQRLVQEALRIFFEVREVPGLKKKPSTSELLDWLKLLLNEDMTPEMLRERDPRKLIPPLHGALLKNEQDVHLFERLAVLSRRGVERPPGGVERMNVPGENGGAATVGSEHYDVVIAGAGISGVGAAYHLTRQCPGTSFVILETQKTFGGTWSTHRYPGIRSDSDLHTFGYRFKPWTSAPIATAKEILSYMGEVIEENRLDQHIRYNHKILSANWSSADNTWTIEATRTDTGEAAAFTCGFLWMCQGYYRQKHGYTP